MTGFVHKAYLGFLSAIVILAFIAVLTFGYRYYILPRGERVYTEAHSQLKPSGTFGHGYGISGSLFMISGVMLYMARKRFRILSRTGLLKHWLEFHIFLCTLGPLLILFHTAFKFGGLVAVSFWSMAAVFASGIVGRFIYLQIPRSIEGRSLTLNEIRGIRSDIIAVLKSDYNLDEDTLSLIAGSVKMNAELYHKNIIVRYLSNYFRDRASVRKVKETLGTIGIPGKDVRRIVSLVKEDISINRRIERLDLMQDLFKYWHVAHLPFALVMIIIMIVHITVSFIFGYRWIF